MWDILPLCPNLRYLSFCSYEGNASRISAIITSINIFRTLTRISLRGIQAKSVRILIQALNDAASDPESQTLPLTHIRLDVKCSLLKRDVAYQLIEALGHASIRVLCLSQLQYARPEILQHIATHLPLLESLTLRHQQRIMSNDMCSFVWPCPAYEYAHALRAFPRLSFFGFNNDLWRIAYTPLFLVEAEDNYTDVEGKKKTAWKEWFDFRNRDRQPGVGPQDVAFHPESRDYFGDSVSDILPRLFAIHCPTLRLLQAGYDKWAFDHRDGRIVARTNKDLTPAERDAGSIFDPFDREDWSV